MLSTLKDTFKVFMPGDELVSYEELASGHINDTFLVKTEQNGKYILQKINKGVFGDVPGLILNKVKVSQHLHQKLSFLSKEERQKQTGGACTLFDCTWPLDWPEENIPRMASFEGVYPKEIREMVLKNWTDYGFKV